MRAVFVSLAVFSLLIPAVVAQGAEACGVCHSKLLSEWQSSPHARSWSSERFQSEVQKTQNSEFCAGCHASASIWEQVKIEAASEGTGILSPKSIEPAEYDAVLSGAPAARADTLEEGDNCGTCHLVQVFSPAGNRADFAGPYHTVEGHAGRETGEFKTLRICGACHGRGASSYLPDGASLGTDYYHAGVEAIQFNHDSVDCNTCHMPRREARLVQLRTFRNLPPRQVGSHNFSEARYDGLAAAIEFSAAGSELSVTNRGLGHPFRICADSQFQIRISATRGNEKVGTHEQGFLTDRRLSPGETMSLALPFQLQGGESVRIQITLQKPGEEPKAVLDQKIQAS